MRYSAIIAGHTQPSSNRIVQTVRTTSPSRVGNHLMAATPDVPGAGIGNIGNQDLDIGKPKENLHNGLFYYASCHKHYHWNGFAKYEIVDDAGHSWSVAKRGYCATDTVPLPG
jgi:hypothetical protein